MREPWLIRQNERAAALSWRSRLRKAALYAGLVWFVALAGIFVLKYAFDLIERPILTVLVQSAVLPLVLFGCLIYGYRQADLANDGAAKKSPNHKSSRRR